MEPRISIITLGVKDLVRSLKFYRDGLELPTNAKPDSDIVFFQMWGTVLALYSYDHLAKDVSDEFLVERSKFPGITLAYNTRTKEEVDTVLAQAKAAGAKIEKPAQTASWGGYSGYFSDPDGYLWEVAFAGNEFREDGSIVVT